MIKQISSLQNPLIKQLVLLQSKSRERRKSGLFIIEGQREISLALKGSYSIQTILVCPEIIEKETFKDLKNQLGNKTEYVEVSSEVYEKISYRNSTEGILAICVAKDLSLKNLQIKNENPLILVVEAPEKPGNIGAILRTADAAGLDAVIIANPKTDLYNPNIIRSSVGCVFTKNIGYGSTREIISYLKEKSIRIYCAALQSSEPYNRIDFNNPSAIVVGTEDTGLTEEWLKESDQNIIIPMSGEIDSMNVSVAAGIIIFEAKRQRGF